MRLVRNLIFKKKHGIFIDLLCFDFLDLMAGKKVSKKLSPGDGDPLGGVPHHNWSERR